MIDPSLVSAVLVTRGDVDLSEILASIADAGITETVVWNNAERENLQCYGRFAAIAETTKPYIYVQDDDLIAPVTELLAEYDHQADRDVVANRPAAEEWRFLGCGALFHRYLVEDGWLDAYTSRYGHDRDFDRVADVVFLYSHTYRSVDLGHRNLPWGFATPENPRMYGLPDHYNVRLRARARTLAIGRHEVTA